MSLIGKIFLRKFTNSPHSKEILVNDFDSIYASIIRESYDNIVEGRFLGSRYMDFSLDLDNKLPFLGYNSMKVFEKQSEFVKKDLRKKEVKKYINGPLNLSHIESSSFLDCSSRSLLIALSLEEIVDLELFHQKCSNSIDNKSGHVVAVKLLSDFAFIVDSTKLSEDVSDYFMKREKFDSLFVPVEYK